MPDLINPNHKPVLVFDLGRVLINFDPDIIISRLLPYTYWSRDDIYRLFSGADFMDAFERGKISSEDFFDILIRVLSLKGISTSALMEIWNDMFYPNLAMLSLIKFVHDYTDITLVLLSNISQVHFEYLYGEYSELSLFDYYVLSYKVGYRKPERMIYTKVIDIKNQGGIVLYTDDIEHFVYSARSYGIDAVHFKNYELFLAELLKRPIFKPYFEDFWRRPVDDKEI